MTAPFPLMPAKSTELRLDHFDGDVYVADSTTLLYKFVDAMCGDAGAGSLKKEIFLQRLSGALAGIYGSDLDYIFGNVSFLSRGPSESYDYDSMGQMLTSDQWDEIEVKDQWYRQRITEFFTAATMGSMTDGIRHVVHAALSCDCDVMENWRYIDSYGLSGNVGRAPITTAYQAVDLTTGHTVPFGTQGEATTFVAGKSDPTKWQVQAVGPRNEVTIKPYKSGLTSKDRRMLRDMLDKTTPQDTIMTIDPNGLSVSTPVKIRSITADSTYYQVEKVVTATPVLDQLPTPELLAIDLDPTEQWLFSKSPELAPYAKFNITQEYGYYYLVSGGARSPIDSVTYGLLNNDGTSVTLQKPFELFESSGQFSDYISYEIADSPDNYPGGKLGLTPNAAPAINPDGSPYQFDYASQAEYVAKRKNEVLAMGGIADDEHYRLPVEKAGASKRTYTPDLAIAYSAPARDSTVTSSWTARKPRTIVAELTDGRTFVRS